MQHGRAPWVNLGPIPLTQPAGLEIDLQHVMVDVRQLSKTSSCGSPLSF
jgi:hypothetical protein